MLKYLIQKGYVNVNKLLLENYHNFGLSELEFVVLLKLFEMLKNNQATISVTTLAKRMSMSLTECSNVLNGLFNRGLVSLDLETTKQGKTKESFNLNECIKFIEDYFYNEMRSKEAEENQDEIKEIIKNDKFVKSPRFPLLFFAIYCIINKICLFDMRYCQNEIIYIF